RWKTRSGSPRASRERQGSPDECGKGPLRYTWFVKGGFDMGSAHAKEVRLSSKHQIVIPRESREVLGLKRGDRLIVVTLGEKVIVLRKPIRHAEATAGLGRG